MNWGYGSASDRVLPDTILVDLASREPWVVFVEAVATDDPITAARREALLVAAGFKPAQGAFMTAFTDRDSTAFRKAVADLACGSFARCPSEPDHLIAFCGVGVGGAGKRSAFKAASGDE